MEFLLQFPQGDQTAGEAATREAWSEHLVPTSRSPSLSRLSTYLLMKIRKKTPEGSISKKKRQGKESNTHKRKTK